MATIKEERDALLERKLKEMGEMGSSPHTMDNSPFFDPPNEVFFMQEAKGKVGDEAVTKQEEQKKATVQHVELVTDETKDFTSENAPLEGELFVGGDTPNEKPKKSPTTKHGIAKRRADFAEYQQRFLAPNVFEIRTQFTVNKETTDLMKIILQDLGSKTTLTAYIENILRDHISEYRDLINHVTAKRRRKETIPE